MEINLAGPYNLTRAVVPHLKEKGGSIVNISSVAGKNMSLGAGMHYTTTKWGLIGFSRHTAYELSPYGIRVNIVCPGPTRTGLINGDDEAAMAKLGEGVPLGRPVEATDVANAILFFISPLSTMCTGSELVVDGGVLIGSGNTLEQYYNSRGGEMPARKIAEKEA